MLKTKNLIAAALFLVAPGASFLRAQDLANLSEPAPLVLPDAPLATPEFADQNARPPKPKPDPCPVDANGKQTMTPAQLKAEEEQHIAGIVPNFNTVIGGCAPPLTSGEKWNLVYHSTVNPFAFGLAIFLGGVDEVTGEHNGYGWGPGGYFKRAGAQYADTASATVIGNGLLPVLLHQDPRYFQLGTGHSIRQRVWHAAVGNFVCRGDNGKSQFNTSNIAGNFIAGGISNLYYPANERGVGLTFKSSAVVSLEGVLNFQLLEFSPELGKLANKVLHHGKQPLSK